MQTPRAAEFGGPACSALVMSGADEASSSLDSPPLRPTHSSRGTAAAAPVPFGDTCLRSFARLRAGYGMQGSEGAQDNRVPSSGLD